MDEEKEESKSESKRKLFSRGKMIAKKDFVIHCNKVHIEIKEGDDLGKMDIPEKFMINLKTEKVI